MTGKQYYRRYPDDVLKASMGLSLEEKGAYSLCLDLIYSNGGPIPDDARWLAGVCGVSLRKWKSLRESLVSGGKLFVVGGRLSDKPSNLKMARAEHE